MQSFLTCFSLSKNIKFHENAGKIFGKQDDIYEYNSFAKFFCDIKQKRPSILLIDCATVCLTQDVLEVFCEDEYSFISSIILVNDCEVTKAGDFGLNKAISATTATLASCMAEAAILAVRNSVGVLKANAASNNVVNMLLNKLGFQTRHIGTILLHSAIDIVCKNGNCITSFNRSLYPALAKKYSTCVNNIERNIRNSIKGACRANGKQIFEKLLNINIGDHEFPPNRTLITALCNTLLNTQNKYVI